ncbi:MAG: putative DNA binding domain-containing protein [Xanthomonadales bacterium]|jgi:ATP-dependent DNA helicase RecG|nr:putative DNA binding domain-containing protein [Xanthomonadales bacterium]
MLNSSELLALLSDLEFDRIERTPSVSNTDRFAQAVCAFANDFPNRHQPGYLIIGADDAGRPTGLSVTDQLLQNLGALRSDGNILPIPAISVSRVAVDGGELAVVEVQPSDLPPVRYRGQVWIRVGPRKVIASEQEERLLMERRIAHARSFDAQPCRDATLEDLDAERFLLGYRRRVLSEAVTAENHRDLRHQLASLRFYDLRAEAPTHAGLLLFAPRPAHFMPGAYVQFLRMEGTDNTSPVQLAKELHADLATLLQTLDIYIDAHIRSRPVYVSTLREETVHDYPRTALRELLANAVMHRNYQSNTPVRFYWYADHVQIDNPGGLYGEAAGHFPKRNDYRNPVVAEAMRALGYVNRYGQGIARAQRALRDNGNPPAEFRTDSGWFSVTIRAREIVG